MMYIHAILKQMNNDFVGESHSHVLLIQSISRFSFGEGERGGLKIDFFFIFNLLVVL